MFFAGSSEGRAFTGLRDILRGSSATWDAVGLCEDRQEDYWGPSYLGFRVWG